MVSRYIAESGSRKRALMFDNEPRFRLLNCMYHEHMLYTGNNYIDYIHEPRFHYAHYLALKRVARSMQRTRIRNRCLFSGSARAVIGLFKMSRFTFKMYARSGRINGVMKSSW